MTTGSERPAVFLELLTLLFIGLKLTENIEWPWWWVLAPIWIPFAVGALWALADHIRRLA